jgi:3-oxoacyl-[acyl-carrier protein] reductase
MCVIDWDFVAEAKKAFGRLDALVNKRGRLLVCALRAVQRAGISPSVQHECAGHVPHDRSRFGGSIINIGSEASVTAYPTLSIYVASKGAVNGLTRVLSKEFGPRKMRVNALNPGGTETEGAHAAGVKGTESKKQIIASTPLGRVGRPEDIARVAVFLASDDAGWLPGEIIFANGGNK